MPRKVYYGDFQRKRRRDSRKRFIITIAVIVIIGAVVWLTIFFGATGQKDVADAVKDNVQEITQLKLQLKEKDDRIAALEAQIAEYEAELAIRPTLPPAVIEPPNEEVLSGQPVSAAAQAAAPTATPKPKQTKSPVSTKESGRSSSETESGTSERASNQNDSTAAAGTAALGNNTNAAGNTASGSNNAPTVVNNSVNSSAANNANSMVNSGAAVR